MYLQPLADRFVRLVLQLLARYAVWLAKGLSARSASTGATLEQDGAVSQVRKTCLFSDSCLVHFRASRQ